MTRSFSGEPEGRIEARARAQRSLNDKWDVSSRAPHASARAWYAMHNSSLYFAAKEVLVTERRVLSRTFPCKTTCSWLPGQRRESAAKVLHPFVRLRH